MSDTITTDDWAFLDQPHETIPWDAAQRLADRAAESAEARRRLLDIVFAEDGDPDSAPDVAPWLLAGAALLLIGPRLSDADRRELARHTLALFIAMDEQSDFDYEFVDMCVGRLGPVVLPEVLAALDEEEQIDTENRVSSTLRSLLELASESDDPALREPVIARCMSELQQLAEDADGRECDVGCYFNTAWALARMGHTPAQPLLAALAQRRYPGTFGKVTAAEFGHALACLEGRADAGKYSPFWTSPPQPWIEQWWTNATQREDSDADDWDDEPLDIDAADLLPYISPLVEEDNTTNDAADWPTPYRRSEPKIGRNDPCPCGSGRKYKKCCGTKA